MSGRAGPTAGDYFQHAAPQPAIGLVTIVGQAYHVGAFGAPDVLFGISNRFGGGQFVFFGSRASTNQLYFRTQDTGVEAVIPNVVPTDTWFDVAMTLDRPSGLFTGYWKARGAGAWNSATSAFTSTWTPAFFGLGTDEWGSSLGRYVVDNLRVYIGRVLTPAQLVAEANSNIVVDATNLWAWWKLRAENLLVDSSGSGNPLTAVGAPVAFTDSPNEAPSDTTVLAVGPAISTSTTPMGQIQLALLGAVATSTSVVPDSTVVIPTLMPTSSATSTSVTSAGTITATGPVPILTSAASSTSVVLTAGPLLPPVVSTKDAFARIRVRAAKVIARFGAPITFYLPGIPAAQNADTTWTDAIDATRFTGTAIETRGEAEGLDLTAVTAGLALRNPVVVLVAAEGLPNTPVPEMAMDWANMRRTVKRVQPVAPNGRAIYFIVVGDI